MASSKKMKFEEQMKRLEEIVSILEKDDTDLDVSLQLYEEGLLLSKELQGRLQSFEQKIAEISRSEDDE